MKADSSCSFSWLLGTVTSVVESWAHAAALQLLGALLVELPKQRRKWEGEGKSALFMAVQTPGDFRSNLHVHPMGTKWNKAGQELLWMRKNIFQHLECGFSSLGSGKVSCGTGASHLLGAGMGDHWYVKTVWQGVYKQPFTAEAACVALPLREEGLILPHLASDLGRSQVAHCCLLFRQSGQWGGS